MHYIPPTQPKSTGCKACDALRQRFGVHHEGQRVYCIRHDPDFFTPQERKRLGLPDYEPLNEGNDDGVCTGK